jgi:hypothetical protein
MLPQSKRSLTGELYQLPGHWRRCHAVEEEVKDCGPARLANHQALPTHREGASAAVESIRDRAAWSFRFVWTRTKSLGP